MPARRTTTLLLRAALVLLGTLALVLLVLAIGLQPYARKKTREALVGLDGARGDFRDVQVSLFPLRYTITRLKISEKDSLLKQPSFYAERLAVTLRWGSLLHGVFRGTVDGHRVKIVLEEPPPGPDQPLPPLSRIIPVRAVVDRAQLRDSEVLYAWVHKQGWPTLWVHDIEATADSGKTEASSNPAPTPLKARK
jgi:hypothetical protein